MMYMGPALTASNLVGDLHSRIASDTVELRLVIADPESPLATAALDLLPACLEAGGSAQVVAPATRAAAVRARLLDQISGSARDRLTFLVAPINEDDGLVDQLAFSDEIWSMGAGASEIVAYENRQAASVAKASFGLLAAISQRNDFSGAMAAHSILRSLLSRFTPRPALA